MRKVNKSSAVLSEISKSLSCGITRVRDQFLTLQEAITNIQSDLCIKQGKEFGSIAWDLLERQQAQL